ncbi:MAG TPA: PIG-L family deacetylase [Micrococcaceae bacterium]
MDPTTAVMPDDWHRALLIMAHPDDAEYGAAAAVAQWGAAGKEICYVLATRGEAGIDGMDPAQASAVRTEEQRSACSRVGVRQLEFLDYPDGRLEQSLELRRDLARSIRRHRPDGIITMHFGQTWGRGRWNSADHRALGTAVQDAVADAANEWIFPELSDQGLAPHAGVRWVAVASPAPTHWVDVSAESCERATESLSEHVQYLRALSDDPVEVQARRQVEMVTGGPEGSRRRVGFELYSM